jgi:ribosomal protein S18 acetylase RimI-like enzyme
MYDKLKNIAYLNPKQIQQLHQITSNPELMKTIGTGKPLSWNTLQNYIKDEQIEETKSSKNRTYWSFAILSNNNVAGFFVLKKIKLTPDFIKYHNDTNNINSQPSNKNNKNIKKTIKNKAVSKKKSSKKIPKLSDQDITLITRIIVDKKYQGKGLASNAVGKIIKMIPSSFAKKKVNVLSIIDSSNIASIKVFTKYDFNLIGTHDYHSKDYNVYLLKI